MTDISLYERAHRNRQEQASGVALGRIIDVDSKKRLCTVVTMMGAGSMNDQVLSNCMWLGSDANPEGDESGCIPRRGTMGLVFFVDGATFFWGAFNALGIEGSAEIPGSTTNLVEGDKITSTLSGNRIAVKRSGLLELFSSDTLKLNMFRTNQGTYKLQGICGEYELNVTDGGTINWLADPNTTASLYRAEYRKDLARSFIITEEKGGVTPDIISRTYIGPALPGYPQVSTPVFTDEITIAGERTTTLSLPQIPGTPAGYKSVIGPDGSISIKAGVFQTTAIDVGASGAVAIDVNKLAQVNISEAGDIEAKGPVASMAMSAVGAIELKNAMAKATISVAGDIEISNTVGKVTISAAGEVTIDSPTKVTIKGKTGIDVASLAGPINVESKVGAISVKGKNVSIDGGLGMMPLEAVLTSPTTLSPFTGAPLMPGSMTVKVSI